MKKTNIFYCLVGITAIALSAGCSNKKYNELSDKIDTLSTRMDQVLSYTQETRDSVNALMPVARTTKKKVSGLYGRIDGVGKKVDGLVRTVDFYAIEEDSARKANEDAIDEKFASTDSSISDFRERYEGDMKTLKEEVSKKQKRPKGYIGPVIFGWHLY